MGAVLWKQYAAYCAQKYHAKDKLYQLVAALHTLCHIAKTHRSFYRWELAAFLLTEAWHLLMLWTTLCRPAFFKRMRDNILAFQWVTSLVVLVEGHWRLVDSMDASDWRSFVLVGVFLGHQVVLILTYPLWFSLRCRYMDPLLVLHTVTALATNFVSFGTIFSKFGGVLEALLAKGSEVFSMQSVDESYAQPMYIGLVIGCQLLALLCAIWMSHQNERRERKDFAHWLSNNPMHDDMLYSTRSSLDENLLLYLMVLLLLVSALAGHNDALYVHLKGACTD